MFHSRFPLFTHLARKSTENANPPPPPFTSYWQIGTISRVFSFAPVELIAVRPRANTMDKSRRRAASNRAMEENTLAILDSFCTHNSSHVHDDRNFLLPFFAIFFLSQLSVVWNIPTAIWFHLNPRFGISRSCSLCFNCSRQRQSSHWVMFSVSAE